MKRYLVFGFDQFYPCGGLDDLLFGFDNLGDLHDIDKDIDRDEIQILNTESMEALTITMFYQLKICRIKRPTDLIPHFESDLNKEKNWVSIF